MDSVLTQLFIWLSTYYHPDFPVVHVCEMVGLKAGASNPLQSWLAHTGIKATPFISLSPFLYRLSQHLCSEEEYNLSEFLFLTKLYAL